jgi:hypothetical protein
MKAACTGPFQNALAGLAALILAMSIIRPAWAQDAVEAHPPNVALILTDDQGWGDLSLHGNENLRTPHFDALAREGARLKHFYVQPVCSPTRAELLTGRYHPRGGV